MPRGNPSLKLAVSMDPDTHARVLAAAEAEGSSVSAWLTRAARSVLRIRDGLAAVAEWEAEHGAITEAEMEAARRKLGLPDPKPTRKLTPEMAELLDGPAANETRRAKGSSRKARR